MRLPFLRPRNGSAIPTIGERHQYHDFIELFPSTQARIFEKCAPLYESGYSLREIEAKTGIPRTTIRTSFIENGLPLREASVATSIEMRRKRGLHAGGIPYGWSRLDGHLIMDAREQKVIREMMKLHQSGTSYHAIAKHLNNKKVPTRLNGQWRDSTVKLIINRQKNNQQMIGGSNE